MSAKVKQGLKPLCSKKDCYMAKVGCRKDARSAILLNNAANESEESSEDLFKLLNDALHVLKVDEPANREPLILLLDHEVQMLPWENLPIFRQQEVYRMPSFKSIIAILGQEPFPSIDPFDSFYLLNPDGDLPAVEVVKWCKRRKSKRKINSKPTVEELDSALTSHDLFIYVGHGSGEDYYSSFEIEKLEKCVVPVLMGCSSGLLEFSGSYAPSGAPLSYLLAGSPAIFANLWDVVSCEIGRFTVALLAEWHRVRQELPTECLQCNHKSKSEGRKRKGHREADRDAESDMIKCRHLPKLGAFMEKARDSCELRYLTGAAPVCYGVPVGIYRK